MIDCIQLIGIEIDFQIKYTRKIQTWTFFISNAEIIIMGSGDKN